MWTVLLFLLLAVVCSVPPAQAQHPASDSTEDPNLMTRST